MRSRSRSLFDATKDQHREAVASAPVPRNARVLGSPEWCYQTMVLLKSSYRHINIDQERFTHYLNELREHRAWEKVPVDKPYGSEAKMIEAELGKRIDEIATELDAAKQQLDVQKINSADRNDRVDNDARPVGTNQHSEPLYDKQDDVQELPRAPTGNRIGAMLRRLRHAAEDDERIAAIYQRVLDGEITTHAGMVEAGFRKKRQHKKLTAKDRIKKLIVKLLPELSVEDCAELQLLLDQ